MLRHYLGKLIVVARTHDHGQIIATRDRIDFADTVHVGECCGNFVGFISFGVQENDGGQHCGSPFWLWSSVVMSYSSCLKSIGRTASWPTALQRFEDLQ